MLVIVTDDRQLGIGATNTTPCCLVVQLTGCTMYKVHLQSCYLQGCLGCLLVQAGSRPSSAGAASPHMQRAPSQASYKRQDSMCIKVARDQDFQDQIGANQWFDMMDPMKVSLQ